SRGRVRGLCLGPGVGEVSGAERSGRPARSPARTWKRDAGYERGASVASAGLNRHLDNDALDHSRQPRSQLFAKDRYGLYQVTDAPSGNWTKPGDLLVLADKLALDVLRQARVTAYKRLRDVHPEDLEEIVCSHPLKDFHDGYDFPVP